MSCQDNFVFLLPVLRLLALASASLLLMITCALRMAENWHQSTRTPTWEGPRVMDALVREAPERIR